MSFTSRNSSMPSRPPSRPNPLSFSPPKGAWGTAGMASFAPITPYSSCSATRQHPRPLGNGVFDMSADLLESSLIDQRPDVHPLLQAIAHLELPDTLHEFGRAGLKDRFLDVMAVGADTC